MRLNLRGVCKNARNPKGMRNKEQAPNLLATLERKISRTTRKHPGKLPNGNALTKLIKNSVAGWQNEAKQEA